MNRKLTMLNLSILTIRQFMICFRGLPSVIISIGLGVFFAASSATAVDFSYDVRPILSDKCYKCHGPDAQSREADLRLDVRDEAEYVLSSEDSELLRRVFSEDPDEVMPPPSSKLKLSDRERQVLQEWIADGAPYAGHWSFQPIRKPKVPSVTVDLPGWSVPVPGFPTMNAIDHFIAQKLLQRGLHPQPQASRERLIRRLTFDLTGLPPTREDIERFVNDASSDAYENLVDRLLAQDAFGERIAADWLDVARYSDSYGYQVDRDRFVWPWRDWVIRAINENLSYDQFITWQLAGDLLPEATDEQILATTFNRLHPQKVEGGSVPEEFRVEYVADRTHTFGTAFLGLTLECCRCHDHKYDPISQREYYQLFAFFNNIDEAGLYSYFTESIPTPTLLLTDDQQKQKIKELRTEANQMEESARQIALSQKSAFKEWLNSNPEPPTIIGQIAHRTFEEGNGANATVEGKVGSAAKLTGDDGIGLKVGNFRRSEPFSVGLWMNTPDVKERAVVFHRSRAWTDAGSRGYQLLIENGKLSASLIHFWPGNAIRVRTVSPIPTGQWIHVTVTYDGSSRADGLKIFVDGQEAEVEVVRDNLYKNITGGGGDNITIGQRFRDKGFRDGLVDEFRVYNRELTPLEVESLVSPSSLGDRIRQASADPPSVDEDEALFAFYLANFNEAYRNALAALQQARRAYNEYVNGLQEIMVMRDMEPRRQTYVLNRGMYDAPTDPVEPKTPEALPALPIDEPQNRLGLARWLVSDENPLAARVAANRFWKICFGNGLVRTPEDFGSQGEPPTHPRLLDWLASDFRENGWDVKRLIKQLVMSATYRQESFPLDPMIQAELLRVDPQNRLLARAPRYRLDAEMIRDNALAVSRLLVNRIGGPPAKPYEVTVSFKPVDHDKGEGLYRRSVYTYWKRTAPAPVMMTLDAAKREVCAVKRERTASPLQAFVLLNDPQFIEAARVMAENLLKTEQPMDSIIDQAFHELTGRRPASQERQILKSLFDKQLEYFTQQPDAAKTFLAVGERGYNQERDPARLAALAVVANTIMNYDECVTKR